MAGQFVNADDVDGAFFQGPWHHSTILHRLLLVLADPLYPGHQLIHL